ncbi:MAG: DNA-directed RNA polymerase subunit delta [Bacilli bacterium]|jgi:DNA-directed RNA polymerase subunit delta|nr:DNA-directed RNA polymerase subunit delta [Bacilli bacterium]
MPMKSLVNAAYDVLTKKYADDGNKSVPIEFPDLLVAVGQELGYETEEELLPIASRFYTDLTLDGRFVIKEGNTWVLREHELFENIHIDMNEVYDLDNYKDEDETDKVKSSDDDGDDEDEVVEKRNDDEEEELGEESEDERERVLSTDDDE